MGDTSMSFIRVRAASGPLHEFYAAAEEVAVNPDLYHVLDPELVEAPGEVVYVEAPAPQVIQPARQRADRDTGHKDPETPALR